MIRISFFKIITLLILAPAMFCKPDFGAIEQTNSFGVTLTAKPFNTTLNRTIKQLHNTFRNPIEKVRAKNA